MFQVFCPAASSPHFLKERMTQQTYKSPSSEPCSSKDIITSHLKFESSAHCSDWQLNCLGGVLSCAAVPLELPERAGAVQGSPTAQDVTAGWRGTCGATMASGRLLAAPGSGMQWCHGESLWQAELRGCKAAQGCVCRHRDPRERLGSGGTSWIVLWSLVLEPGMC